MENWTHWIALLGTGAINLCLCCIDSLIPSKPEWKEYQNLAWAIQPCVPSSLLKRSWCKFSYCDAFQPNPLSFHSVNIQSFIHLCFVIYSSDHSTLGIGNSKNPQRSAWRNSFASHSCDGRLWSPTRANFKSALTFSCFVRICMFQWGNLSFFWMQEYNVICLI